MLRSLPTLAAVVALLTAATAQSLLRDINPTRYNNGSLACYEGITVQGVLYCPGNRWDTGTELWRSDGTVAGTRLVRDVRLGPGLSQVQNLATNGSLVFFTGVTQVFRSDGTEAGTYAIGTPDQTEAGPVPAGARMVWATRDGGTTRLLGSDGISSTPVLLMTMSNIGSLVSSGNSAWLAAQHPVNGFELWRTDGTVAGTSRVPLAPGVGVSYPGAFTSDGVGGIWFAGTQPGAGAEPWHSDGTFAGTQMLADIHPGNSSSDPANFCVLGSQVFFTAWGPLGEELYVTNGTAAGTQLVRDILPGIADSSPRSLYAVPALGRVLFNATDPTAGREPWVSDGTPAGTVRLGDLAPGTANSVESFSMRPAWLGDTLWFAAQTPAVGQELFRTDGTPAGTALVADLVPGPTGSDPRPLGVVANGTVLFSVYSPSLGVELWKLTPRTTVPTLLGDFHPSRPEGSFPTWTTPLTTRAAELDGRQHFAAGDPSLGIEPHVHNGTPTGTLLVGEVVAGSGGRSRLLAATSTHVYYETTNGFLSNDQRLVAVPRTGPPIVLRNGVVLGFAVLRDRLLFGQAGTNSEPMITDGTVAGTVRIADVRPGIASSVPTAFVTIGERVYFFADDGVVGREMWVTDGTSVGTSLAVDCIPGAAGLNPSNILAGPTRMFFGAAGGLWSSDGTPAGTSLLPALSGFVEGALLGDVLIFPNGSQLWRTDGTLSGTFLLGQTDAFGDSIRYPCAARGRVFCSVLRASTGPELWSTDGTIAGTGPVLSLHPETQLLPPNLGTAGLAHVMFARTTASTGTELWVTDGTANGTALIVDAEPGSAPSNPVFALGDTTAGGQLTWWADTVPFGLEPWSVPLASFGGADFDRYGVGCPGSLGVPHIQGDGLPILGSPRFAWQLRNALPTTLTLLQLGFTRTPGAGPCILLNSGEVSLGLVTDSTGRAEHAIAVPATASLAGFTVSGQFIVLDSLGGFLGLAAATAGLEALVGR